MGHPPELLAAEKTYIVRWGCKESLLAATASLLLVVAVGFLAVWSSPLWLGLMVPPLAAGALGVLFFRNPSRRVPGEPGLIVAPADGRVVEVIRMEEKEYIRGEAYKVGIFMSIFNVHVNRAPCSGQVEYLCHRPGIYLDARNPRSPEENESQATGILRRDPGGPEGVKVLVRQVAGAVARRIVCPLSEGQHLERGRLMGMIKYGSRVEVLVSLKPGEPPLNVLVKVGDRVSAGSTVLFRY